MLERIGQARVVLLGAASYGTSEFHRMRAAISQALIQRGFDFVAVEGDWADAARLDDYVLGNAAHTGGGSVSAFPTWLWQNAEVDEFATWLRRRNLTEHARRRPVGFHGLDLYSPFASMTAVAGFLDGVDARAAEIARSRYGLLTPWQKDSRAFGRNVFRGRYQDSETEVLQMLRVMLDQRLERARTETHRFYDAAQNARVAADAESYYRAMFYGSSMSWNLRDAHMFESLKSLLSFYGSRSRGIVWAHNAHVGDAQGTEMTARGEVTLGQLARKQLGNDAYLIGLSSHHGTVAASPDWDAPMQRMRMPPARSDSYEHLLHGVEIGAFTLPLRHPATRAVRDELLRTRSQRNIGVVYRPERELENHYFRASLPRQFDELVWFDETSSVESHAVDVRARETSPKAPHSDRMNAPASSLVPAASVG
jgi:erythromycin esterase-like protein